MKQSKDIGKIGQEQKVLISAFVYFQITNTKVLFQRDQKLGSASIPF